MVENSSYYFQKGVSGDGVIGLASPKDRLAAYVVDTILVLPLVQLFQSPIKRLILESSIFGETESLIWLRIINFLIFVAAFLFYYGFMTSRDGQTIGKKCFSIQVISYKGHISFFNAVTRSFSILTEFLLLGLPFLSIFSHPLRRPIHDRVADTLVISLKSPVGYPSKMEILKTRVATVFASFVLVMFIAASLLSFFSSVTTVDSFGIMEKTCEQSLQEVDSQISPAIELFMGQKISERCLYDLSRGALWNKDVQDLAYLGMSLSVMNQQRLSDQYFLEICKANKEGLACQFTRWVDDNMPTSLENSFVKDVSQHQDSSIFKVYISSVMLERGEYVPALALMKNVRDVHLSDLTSLISFKSLLGAKQWGKAYWVYHTRENINDEHVVGFLMEAREQESLSAREQLNLLEEFYPDMVKGKNLGRGLASSSIDEGIFAIYQMIREEL